MYAFHIRQAASDELLSLLLDSLKALFTHADSANTLRNDFVEALVLIKCQSAAESLTGEGRVQVTVQSYNEWAQPALMLWDVLESTGWARAAVNELEQSLEKACVLQLSRIVKVMQLADSWIAPEPLPSNRPLWRYHPQRLIDLMPWGKGVAAVGKHLAGSAMTMTGMRAVSDALVEARNEALLGRPLYLRVAAQPERGRALDVYAEMLGMCACYFGAGRQLFDFPPELTELFKKTDVDDVQLEHVKLPYSTVYLHFGQQADMPLGNGWFAEGAYLSEVRHPDTGARYLNICVTAGNGSLEGYLAFDTTVEPAYIMGLSTELHTMALGEAVEQMLSNKIARLRHEIDNEPLALDIEKMKATGQLPPGAVSVQKRNAEQQLALLMPRHESFLKMLRLIVNGLVYVTAYPDDVESVWPTNTPPSKLRALAKAKGHKEQSRRRYELARLGFSPVHLCGQRLAGEIAKQNADSRNDTQGVALHWVRGHWRRQVHGPGNSLRKLIWRMPFLRGGRHADPENEPLGHLYLVS